MKINTKKSTLNIVFDPCRLFEELTDNKNDVVLLESKDGNGKNNVRSYLFVDNALSIESLGLSVVLKAISSEGKIALDQMEPLLLQFGVVEKRNDTLTLKIFEQPKTEKNDRSRLLQTGPIDVLQLLLDNFNQNALFDEVLYLPGVFSYDHIDVVEDLPKAKMDIHQFPDFRFFVPKTVVVIDHQLNNTTIVSYNFVDPNKKKTDFTPDSSIENMLLNYSCKKPTEHNTTIHNTTNNLRANVDIDDQSFTKLIEKLKKHIICGDVFQIVASRTFSMPCSDSLGAYKALRELNPSPYLFYLKCKDSTLFGASPETCLSVKSKTKKVSLHPIAGTRPRGRISDSCKIDTDLDGRFEAELKLDEKEIAEHMMLVDLARNDLARICKPGTRRVSRLLEVERYSHVMHLVSVIEGELEKELNPLHAYKAVANMGTLVGAPKIKAASLLRIYENDKRGPYGGAVGYLSSNGELDTAIVIRAAFVKNNIAYVRSGAGIVFDSKPQCEVMETKAKAKAVLEAIAIGGGNAQ